MNKPPIYERDARGRGPGTEYFVHESDYDALAARVAELSSALEGMLSAYDFVFLGSQSGRTDTEFRAQGEAMIERAEERARAALKQPLADRPEHE